MTDNPLASLLNDDGLTGRLKRYVTAVVVARASIEITREVHRIARGAFVHTISVPSGDDVYTLLHERVLALMPERGRRSMIVRSVRQRADGLVPPDGFPSRLASFYDGTREQTVTLDGHRVRVRIDRDDESFMALLSSSRDADASSYRRERMILTAYGARARDAVLALLGDLSDEVNKADHPRFFIATPWGEWMRRDDLEPRELDTVILRRGQRERLVDDLARFLDSRPDYQRVGTPWHRGYLFHGPPGTGKTSLAHGLATRFGLDVYCLPLSGIEDGRLLRLVGVVPERSMLLIEDVDILAAAHDRDATTDQPVVVNDSGTSLFGLLNALDGIATPPGLISVLTTNKPEVLDPALVRRGRVDMTEEVPYLDNDQLARLVALHTGGAFEVKVTDGLRGRRITANDVGEACKVHMGDPAGQVAAVLELIASTPL